MIIKMYYHLTKKETSIKKKKRLFSDFNMLRNEAVSEINDLLEKWNYEYDEMYGSPSSDLDRYNRYICEKQKPYVEKVNNSQKGLKSIVRLDIDPETCDIIGFDKKDDERMIHFISDLSSLL